MLDPELDENSDFLPSEIKEIENEIVQDNAVENNTVFDSDSDSSDDESDGIQLRSGRRVRFAVSRQHSSVSRQHS